MVVRYTGAAAGRQTNHRALPKHAASQTGTRATIERAGPSTIIHGKAAHTRAGGSDLRVAARTTAACSVTVSHLSVEIRNHFRYIFQPLGGAAVEAVAIVTRVVCGR